MIEEKTPSARISVRDLCISHGARTILSHMSFSAGSGEIVEMRGPNGVGKTSVLRVIAGISRPASGSVRVSVAGREYSPGDIHFVGHGDTVKADLPVASQLAYWAAILGCADTATATATAPVMTRMGLHDCGDLPGRALSSGQRRRCALARLLLARRPVWLLDEPLSGLDDAGAALVRELVADHAAGGGLVLAAMHGSGFRHARSLVLATAMGEPVPSLPGPRRIRRTEPSVIVHHAAAAVFAGEIGRAWRGHMLPPLGYYAGCISLLPLALGPDGDMLRAVGPSMLMIGLALAALLPAERLFQGDVEDGSLDAMYACCTADRGMLVLVRLLGLWIGSCGPLILSSPLLWLVLGGSPDSLFICFFVALLASLGFFFLAGIAAALTLRLRYGGVVIALVAMPLFWPIMIFASASLQSHAAGLAYLPALMLTASAALITAVLAPVAAAAALRMALD